MATGLSLGLTAAAPAPTTPPAPAAIVDAAITLDADAPGLAPLPSGLIGLSFESNASSGGINSGRFDDQGNLPALLRTLGVGGTLRFGGSSVDGKYNGATPAALAGLRRLADSTGWQVLYSENLGRYDAAITRRDAAAIATALGPRLAGIACGNEPNLYPGAKRRPADWGLAQYLPEADACLRTVHATTSATPLSGPDTDPILWQAGDALAERGLLTQLNAHYYPMSECGGPSGRADDLISPAMRNAQDSYLATAAAIAHAARLPWQITETNSASCSGIPGVSDTFASALWVVDYLLAAAEHDATAVDFHTALDHACAAYSAICPTSADAADQYSPQPMYYGLLAVRLLGTGTLQPLSLADPSGTITAHAVKTPDGTWRLAIENLGPNPATIHIQPPIPHATTARVLRLTAPSLTATTGVTLQGAEVAADGTFTVPPPEQDACSGGECTAPLVAYSAAVVSL